jgi:hypothetical protein
MKIRVGRSSVFSRQVHAGVRRGYRRWAVECSGVNNPEPLAGGNEMEDDILIGDALVGLTETDEDSFFCLNVDHPDQIESIRVESDKFAAVTCPFHNLGDGSGIVIVRWPRLSRHRRLETGEINITITVNDVKRRRVRMVTINSAHIPPQRRRPVRPAPPDLEGDRPPAP